MATVRVPGYTAGMRGTLLALWVAVTAAATDGDPPRWHQTLSPHFDIQHEAAFSPAGLTLELEKLHNRLRLDLSMFAPWMAKERITLNVYANQQSYLRGRFKPPSWSNGVAFSQLRTVVTYWGQGPKGFSVLGHETTHLLFEGWWAESGKTPPVWLNEGLAMLEETGEAGADKSDWQGALENIDPAEYMSFDRFVKVVGKCAEFLVKAAPFHIDLFIAQLDADRQRDEHPAAGGSDSLCEQGGSRKALHCHGRFDQQPLPLALVDPVF